MNMYDPLFDFLMNRKNEQKIALSINEIEKIINKKLPKSAHTEIQRWENSESHVQAKAWLNAGFLVEHPSDAIKTGIVTFVKSEDSSKINDIENKQNINANKQRQDNSNLSIPCGTLIYMILFPILPLGFSIYYFVDGKDILARLYFRVFLLGIGIMITSLLLLKIFNQI